MDMRKLVVLAVVVFLITPVVISVLAQQQVPTLYYVEYQFSQSIEDYYVVYVDVPSGADTNTLFVVAKVNGSEFAVPSTVIGSRLFFRGGNTNIYRVYWGYIPDNVRWTRDRKLVFHWIEDFDNPYYVDLWFNRNVKAYYMYPVQSYIRFEFSGSWTGLLFERRIIYVPFDCPNMLMLYFAPDDYYVQLEIRLINELTGSVVNSIKPSSSKGTNVLVFLDTGFKTSGLYGIQGYVTYSDSAGNGYIHLDLVAIACGKVPSYTTVSGTVQPTYTIRVYPYAGYVVTVYQPTTVYVPTTVTVTVPVGSATTLWTTLAGYDRIVAAKLLRTTVTVPVTYTYTTTIPVLTTVTSTVTDSDTTYTTVYETTTYVPVVTSSVYTTTTVSYTPYTTVTIANPWYVYEASPVTVYGVVTTVIGGTTTTTVLSTVVTVNNVYEAAIVPVVQYMDAQTITETSTVVQPTTVTATTTATATTTTTASVVQPVPVAKTFTVTITETVKAAGALSIDMNSAIMVAMLIVLGFALGYLVKRHR